VTESTASATERVGRYQLLEPIGSGPTGTAWRAKVFGVAGFDRQFAVKRFLPEVTATPAGAQALSTGARAYGSLEHPRIARMTEFGVAQGLTFTAVELVVGMDALRLVTEVRLSGTTLSQGGALGLVSQVARAIGYAHGRGISHLGLSPTNVIITSDGDVKVTDFAILASTLPPRPVESPRLAQRIAYLAPEQLAGEATSAATDVFALGVLAYELVTGERTFAGDSAAEIAAAVFRGPPTPPALPRPIIRVLERCFARSPFERFPDARAFADALDAALRVAPVSGSRKDIGATVQAALDRMTDLRENQMSGMLALNIGTAPIPKNLGNAPAVPLRAPEPDAADSASTLQDLPKPMTTMPGLMAPAPMNLPAVPPLKRPGSSTNPPAALESRSRPATDPGAGLAVAGGRVEIPPRSPRSATASVPPPLEHPDPADFGAELAALGHEPVATPEEFAEEAATRVGEPRTRSRGMLSASTQPGVGIRPTTPHVVPESDPEPEIAASRALLSQSPTRDIKTDEVSPILAHALGAASTKPTGEIQPLVEDAHHADAMAEFPDETHNTHRAEEVSAAHAMFGAPDPSASAGTTRPGVAPFTAKRAETTTTHRPLSELPVEAETKSSKLPWIILGLATLGVLGGVGYFVWQTMAEDRELSAEEAALSDAHLAPKLPDAAPAVALVRLDAAIAGKPADAGKPVDAGKPAPDAAAPDAAAPPDAAAKPIDAGVAIDAAVVAPTPTPVAGDGLVIASTPAGARLFIDGADQGVTPVKLPGSADHHTAVLLLAGHDLYVAEVEGHGAFTIPLREVTPSTGPAGIKVMKCAKDRYYVTVDGKPTGQLCPTERIGCELGNHTVETYDAVTGTHHKWDITVTDTRLSYRVRVE
jgi:serine/threonine protein kinase